MVLADGGTCPDDRLGLLLWSLIEAPVRGWSSPVVIGAGAGGLVVLAVFAAWEWVSSHRC